MSKPTFTDPERAQSPAHEVAVDAASVLFNLPGYRVLAVTPGSEDEPLRTVLVESLETSAGCPSCGVLTARVHSRPVQQVKDLPCGGDAVRVLVRKRRYTCRESLCDRATFTEETEQLPARARLTTRLTEHVIQAARSEPRALSRVALQYAITWPTVMRLLHAVIDVADLTAHVDHRHVRHLGIDEHRFCSVRYLREQDTGQVRRIEPWSIVFTDLDTGTVLDVVDGRRGTTVQAWLAARPRWWRRRVQLVAIDLSSEFRAAVRKALPRARISADHWHVIRLANEMVTTVRRRRSWEVNQRRGRKVDTSWKYRKLLTCAGSTLTSRQRTRLQEVLEADIELAVAWGIKEHVRQLMATTDIRGFQRAWAALEKAVKASRLPEPRTLFTTLTRWRTELLTFCRTRLTNARTKAANLNAKAFKRVARGYRNHDNYRCRIMGYTTSPTAA